MISLTTIIILFVRSIRPLHRQASSNPDNSLTLPHALGCWVTDICVSVIFLLNRRDVWPTLTQRLLVLRAATLSLAIAVTRWHNTCFRCSASPLGKVLFLLPEVWPFASRLTNPRLQHAYWHQKIKFLSLAWSIHTRLRETVISAFTDFHRRLQNSCGAE